MSDQETPNEPESGADEGKQESKAESFSQADVDRIVKERVQRERTKYADYDDLKKAAEAKKSADERIADLEARYADAEARALRARVASDHGISAEDRDLFLTATDEEGLEKQAKRLAERESERKQRGNYSPNEGTTPSGGSDPMRDFTRDLFQRAAQD